MSSDPPNPATFISWAHGDEIWTKTVATFAMELRRHGVKADVDLFHLDEQRIDWTTYGPRAIEDSEFVLIAVSPTYKERWEGRNDPSQGAGAAREANVLKTLFDSNQQEFKRKVKVVLLNDAAPSEIPSELHAAIQHFHIRSLDLAGLEDLIRNLTQQPRLKPNPVGAIPLLPPTLLGGGESTIAAPLDGDNRFSAPIPARFAELDLIVEHLTADQHRVIRQLTGQRQALISGCAGSGKTLVAAEKAIRLSHAGIATLFLCHNPLLAEWVAELTAGSGVRVQAFEDLVAELSGDAGASIPTDWTNYSQPISSVLDSALERLLESDSTVEAVIVDEGQDFANEWWPLVEGCMADSAGVLYIFFDDSQSLLPFRSQYPISGPSLDLSRNCRNAGRVYELMQRLVSLAPPPEDALSDRGDVVLIHSDPGMLQQSVEACLDWLHKRGAIDRLAVVLGGGVPFDDSVLHATAFRYGPIPDWRSAVRNEFFFLLQPKGVVFSRDSDLRDLQRLLDSLSVESSPTQSDREAVAQAAALLVTVLPPDSLRRPSGKVVWRATPGVTASGIGGQDLRLHPRGASSYPFPVLHALLSGEWAQALPTPLTATFAPHADADADTATLPVFSVGEIKGLEREVILLVMQGEPPEPTHELFVGVSRARSVLAVALDEHAYRTLPPRVRKLVVSPTLHTG
jgi:hypothetical protein